jgi:hypothetical protein
MIVYKQQVLVNCHSHDQGMTSPANAMHVFLWQIGTVIPIQSMITHIYHRYLIYTR